MEKFCIAYWDTILYIIAIVIGGFPFWGLSLYIYKITRKANSDQKEKDAIASSQVHQISSSESSDQQSLCSSSPSAPSPRRKEGYFPE